MRLVLALLGAATAVSVAGAQDVVTGTCATPDSVAFRGQSRVPESELRADIGIAPKSTISGRTLTKAIKDLYATNQFDDVEQRCEIISGKSVLVFLVKERRILNEIKVTGADKVSSSSVKDRVDLLIGKPIDPAQVVKDVSRIDSLYQSEGYYLAKVTVDTVASGELTTLIFHVEEGRRLAISGVEIQGNKALAASTIVGAIATQPEGFFWWKNGEFDQDKYGEDLAKTIPNLYASRGYIDMQSSRTL
jgi:outer membrane protein insertion porin family